MNTDVYSSEKRSAVMRRVKARNTTPELKVRKALTSLGARYRLHRKDLPGNPDIVMPGRRLALFVHGCFWHGHDWPAAPGSKRIDYWLVGARNRDRDAATARRWRRPAGGSEPSLGATSRSGGLEHRVRTF